VKIAFFVCLFFVAYVYVLYPLIVFALASMVQILRDFGYVLSRKDRRESLPDAGSLPGISVLIAACNEERIIEDRIANCLSVDYPRDKMEIIIASDGSTDRTNEIVARHAGEGVKLVAFQDRNGKSYTLNRTIPRAGGEILLLTDSNTEYEKDAVLKLVRHFRHAGVGGVCGELRVKPFDDSTVEESVYWKFENFLKLMESRLDMTLGANGGIYAIRKDAFIPIPDGTIIDDFVIFLNVRKRGFTTLFDPEAIAYERSAPSMGDEYQRKVRIGAGDLQSMRLTADFLDPRSGPVSFAFWSHKVLRWTAPMFLFGLLVSNIALFNEGLVFASFLGVQILMYLLFVVGFLYKDSVFFRLPHYFISMNVALAHGFFRYLRGTQKGTWKRTER
jgi:cellulose synthase/poly-beta-1,6-N-acetylglucosamine synthase-like glycosyltransferase